MLAEMLWIILPGYECVARCGLLTSSNLESWEACTEKILNHTVETKKPCEIWLGYLMAYLGMKVLACDPVISSLV